MFILEDIDFFEFQYWPFLSGSAEEIVVKKGLSRRSIEQLGYVKDINSLVVLSGASSSSYYTTTTTTLT